MSRRNPLKFRRQRGVTLIEVLITVVVMGVGLLGVAALQTVSVKANRTALQRSYATFYAHDILDCMRVNRTAALSFTYNIDFADSPPAPTSIAASDLARWRTALADNLPIGLGKISVDLNGVATVEVQWTESVESDETLTFTTESSL